MSDKLKYQIALTGSNGQLGKELAAISNDYPDFEFKYLSSDIFSLEDPEGMKSWIEQNAVDCFINCAAYTAVDKAESEKEKVFRVNAVAPGLIAALLAKTKTPLIQISTDYVFDGKSSAPLTETAQTAPVNLYGASKLEGEKRVLSNNPLSQVIRTSWLYSSYGNNFVKTMIRLMKEKSSIQVVADQIGSPTYAADLARVILEVIATNRIKPGIYHYSNEGETSWFDFALEIKRLTGSTCEVFPIASSSYPTPASRPGYSLMDKSKIKKDYGISVPDWKVSLAKCVQIIKEQIV